MEDGIFILKEPPELQVFTQLAQNERQALAQHDTGPTLSASQVYTSRTLLMPEKSHLV